MDENRTAGAAKTVGGKIEEGFGRATGDAKTDAAGQMGDSLDDTVRHYIETKPYTTALIALGIGWLIGRAHRPF